jgi:hypothetical protein
MTFKRITSALALAVAALTASASALASANVIDTSVPTGNLAGSNTVDASNWIAERFTLAAPALIEHVSAYVLSGDAGNDLGKTFTLAVYANSASNLPALNWFDGQQGQLFHTTLTYNGDGWNGSTGLNWQLAAGSYWFALEADGNGPSSLQAPTGALPVANAVAGYSGSITGYSQQGYSSADSFGLQAGAASAVPEPATVLITLAGLLVTVGLTRRHQA